MASWLDDLLGKQIQADGTNVPQRKILNFIDATVEDDPSNGRTNVTAGGSGGTGAAFNGALTAQPNSGTTAYPDDAVVAVSTFITAAVGDHDSVRMYADDERTRSPGTQGRITNLTAYVIDLYPIEGESLFADSVDQGTDTPVEIPPGGSVFFMLDADGVAHLA